MFGWTLLLVIATGTIAAVAVAFARFAGVLWPALGSDLWFGAGGMGLSGERAGAIAVIALLTAANLRGLNLGKLVQNAFTTAKVLSLLLIVALGLLIAPNPAAIHANFGGARAFLGGGGTISIASAGGFGAAMVGALFSADAWASVTFAAAEVRNPRRDVPLALALGAGLVILLYLLTNLAYLCELPAATTPGASGAFARGIAHATSDRVASAAMEMRMESGGRRNRRDPGNGFNLWMRQRTDLNRRPRGLCDGARPGVLRLGRTADAAKRPRRRAGDAGGVGRVLIALGHLLGACSITSSSRSCSFTC